MVHYTLNRAPYTIRLLSSLFLFFALSGQIIVVLYGMTRFGLSPDGAKTRYAGDETELKATTTTKPTDVVEPFDDDDDDEPAINLNAVKAPAPEQKTLFFAISWDELLRLTHVHTFAGGMLFYIFGHLFSLTTVRTGLKRALIVVFFLSIATFISGPFFIRYLTRAAVYPFIAAIFAFLGCGVFFAARALWDMWGPPSKTPVGEKRPKNQEP